MSKIYKVKFQDRDLWSPSDCRDYVVEYSTEEEALKAIGEVRRRYPGTGPAPEFYTKAFYLGEFKS